MGEVRMPYDSVADLPDAVRKLPPNKQRQWMSVWNSVYGRDKDEKKAFKIAWGVTNKDMTAVKQLMKFLQEMRPEMEQ